METEEEDVFVIKLPVGNSGGYQIFMTKESIWDEIYSFYEGEEYIHEYEDEDGEIISIDLSSICERADTVYINPSDEIEEFVDQIEDKRMFSILCNAVSDTEKYKTELDYTISTVLANIGAQNCRTEAYSYGKNRLTADFGNRKLYITLFLSTDGVPQRTMTIDLVDHKHNEKTITKEILGEDDQYEQLISYLTSFNIKNGSGQPVDQNHIDVEGSQPHVNDNNSTNSEKSKGNVTQVANASASPTIASLSDGLIKSQTDQITQRLLAKMNAEHK